MHVEARKQHLEEDLRTLFELLNRADALPPRHVRALATPIVRKWLIDGNINLLARDLNCEISVNVPNSSEQIEAVAALGEVLIYTTGGVVLGGTPITSVYYSTSGFKGHALFQMTPHLELMNPGRYLQSKRLYFRGKAYTAHQLMDYMSKKAGGVHFDPEPSKLAHMELSEAAKFLTFAPATNNDEKGCIEVSENGELRVVIRLPGLTGEQWNCLDIELLAMAQALLNIHCNGVALLATDES